MPFHLLATAEVLSGINVYSNPETNKHTSTFSHVCDLTQIPIVLSNVTVLIFSQSYADVFIHEKNLLRMSWL